MLKTTSQIYNVMLFCSRVGSRMEFKSSMPKPGCLRSTEPRCQTPVVGLPCASSLTSKLTSLLFGIPITLIITVDSDIDLKLDTAINRNRRAMRVKKSCHRTIGSRLPSEYHDHKAIRSLGTISTQLSAIK